jgi:hypothetical protein
MASLEGSGAALPFGRGAGMPLGVARAVAVAEAEYAPEPVYERAVRAEVRDLPAVGPLPAPPAMIGPLATSEMVAVAVAVAVALAPAEVVRVKGSLPSEPKLPLEKHPIERCAAIAASIARTCAETAQILEVEKLDPAVWAALDKHWNDAISKEMAKGKMGLLQAYDAAYVAQLEQERGPLHIEEYARLVVALERGGTDEALAEMTLPRGAIIRIERVWLKKIATTPALAASVCEAVDDERER